VLELLLWRLQGEMALLVARSHFWMLELPLGLEVGVIHPADGGRLNRSSAQNSANLQRSLWARGAPLRAG